MFKILAMAFALSISSVAMAESPAPATAAADMGPTVDVGKTGYDTKRLTFAAACPKGCPWGELGEFVRDAMAPDGYEIILCRNCNRAEGPRVVAKASLAPRLVPDDTRNGTIERINAPIDFGVTEASMLLWAYQGKFLYAEDGPYPNLRLIARVEDPTYLLVAVKPELGIKSLAEIRERKIPARIITDFQPSAMPVLEYYGLDKESLESWGGALVGPKGATSETPFDVVVSSLASPANNVESIFWTTLTFAHDLQFLDLPADLLDKMVAEVDMVHTTARWGVLRGVDRPIKTVGRSGEAIFARADMPDDIAYAAAKAIDRSRGELKWFQRPYSIDPLTVADGKGVPLHPGSERYYREKGYLD